MSEGTEPSALIRDLITQLDSFQVKVDSISRVPNNFISDTLIPRIEDGGLEERGWLPSKTKPVDDTTAGPATLAPAPTAEDDEFAEGGSPSESEYGEGDEKFESTDDDFLLPNGEQSAFDWMRSLTEHTQAFHRAAPVTTQCDSLRPGIVPLATQWKAVAMVDFINTTQFKTAFLCDAPGSGKTLVALLLVVMHLKTQTSPSLAVVPASCASQWVTEVEKYFEPNTLRVLHLNDPSVTPLEMMGYDLIVTSYGFVREQWEKEEIFMNKIAEIKDMAQYPTELPKRPNLSLFASLINFGDRKGNFLLLDEANVFKNEDTLIHNALRQLRLRFRTCLLMSGTPIDNTWLDAFSFIQFVEGHQLTQLPDFLRLFAEEDSRKPGRAMPPQHRKFLRFMHVLLSYAFRRPKDVASLPALHIHDCGFALSEKEQYSSDAAYQEYEDAKRESSGGTRKGKKKLTKTQRAARKKAAGLKWAALTKAFQHAAHPQMVELMGFLRWQAEVERKDIDPANADALYSQEDRDKWDNWRETIAQDKNWQSSRVNAIIRIFNHGRDLRPDGTWIIFSESVYFLDIVQTAFAQMNDPVECMRYDGRAGADVRKNVLAEFHSSARNGRVLLSSRGAGGVGLNITAANHCILTEAWWKAGWEEQAQDRLYRTGQMREVFVYRVHAINCKAEGYRTKLRDKKNRHNERIIRALEHADGEEPKIMKVIR